MLHPMRNKAAKTVRAFADGHWLMASLRTPSQFAVPALRVRAGRQVPGTTGLWRSQLPPGGSGRRPEHQEVRGLLQSNDRPTPVRLQWSMARTLLWEYSGNG